MAWLVYGPVAPALGADDAEQRLAEAEQIYRRDGPEAALPLFEDLSAGFRRTNDYKSLGRAIGFIGEIHWRLGNYEQAGDYLERALALKRETADNLQEGKTLNVLGLLHWDLGEFEQAQAYFSQGSAIAEELGDKRLAGAILNNLSLVHDELGDYFVSLEQYQRVLKLYDGVDFPRGEGDTLGNIGGVYLLLGRYREALDHYERALVISEQLDSAISMSQDHGNIALCYLGLGQVDDALGHLDLAVELAVAAGMRQDEAFWLRGKANALVQKGRYDQGLDNHRAALAIYEQLDGKTEFIEALHDMGRLHMLLGDANSAERYYRQSMELAREVGLSRGITTNLLALGDLQNRRGEPEAAVALYAQGAQRAKESGEMAQWSQSLLQLAAVHHDQKRYAESREAAGQALGIARETGALGLEAQAVYAYAELDRLQQKHDEALAGYGQVITALAMAPDSELAWRALYGKGLSMADAGRKDEAILAMQSAIGVIEGVRDRLQQERFRAGYVQDKFQVYVDLVRLQLETGRTQEAFSTAERLRSRSYLDLVDGDRPPDPSAEEQLLEFALKERIRALREALAGEQNLTRPVQRQMAISVYSQELLAAEQEYHAFLDERRQLGVAGRSQAVPTYENIGAKLAGDEALVEYVVGSDSVMLFVLTRESLTADSIPLRRPDLVNKVELVRNLISRRDDDRWRKPAASLARYLLDPVLADGQLEGIKHLYLVPHGSLNYLPFALLPSNAGGSRRVIEDFTLAYLPTAAVLLRPNVDTASSSSMLAMAPARSRLQHAGAEASAVNALFAPDSKALLGESATESAFKQEAANYRLLHLATHGYFNKLNPLLSGLELESDATNDGQLELHEILGLQLAADLVTLSACQTGMGSGHFAEVPAGDDFVGLTRAFLYAGSSSVLATLWEVDDASTAGLMQRFYGGLKDATSNEDRATALAQAQRAFLASEKYRHPYFWAPFVLVGELGRESRTSS